MCLLMALQKKEEAKMNYQGSQQSRRATNDQMESKEQRKPKTK